MKIKYTSEKINPTSTSIEPTQYKFTLTATGSYQEIDGIALTLRKTK